MTTIHNNRSTECSNPSCPCHAWSARMPVESPVLPEREVDRPVSEAKNVLSGDSEPNSPIPAPSGHILYTASNCQVFHDLQGNRQCPVCEGGLAVCRLCNEYEAGLDKPCARAIQDPIVEAREVLAKASRIHALNNRDPQRDEDVGWLLESLCNELETLRSQHSVQADSIKALHEQEKAMRAAIENAATWIGVQAETWTCQHADQPMRCSRCSLRSRAKDLTAQLRAALTPKGE